MNKEWVEPGMENVVLALHKRIEGATATFIEADCCEGATMVYIVPCPYVLDSPGISQQTTGTIHWDSKKKKWIAEIWGGIARLLGSDVVTYECWILSEALEFAREHLHAFLWEPTQEWIDRVSSFPDQRSLHPTKSKIKAHKTICIPILGDDLVKADKRIKRFNWESSPV